MNLEDVSVEIRPRNPWEAIDVGFQLPRIWWREVYIPWLLFILPMIIILTVVFQGIPWLAPLIIWLLKPLYDRLLLSIFSQRLFGVEQSTGNILRGIPALFKTGLYINLTLLRLNPSRSFHLPVWQLEGLRGKKRQKRIQVLSARIYSYPLWLTIVCMHLEALFYFTILGLVFMFIPEGIKIDFLSLFDSDIENNIWFLLLTNLLVFTGMIIIEPFYVAAGFMLYVNRRIRLEGWDIEIAFRRLNQRLKKHITTLGLILIAVNLSIMPSSHLLAEQKNDEAVVPVNTIILDPSESGRVIDEVMQRDEFNKPNIFNAWLPKEEPVKKDIDESKFLELIKELAQLLAVIFKAAAWILVLLLIAIIFLYREKWLFRGKNKKIDEHIPPEKLFGMDITPESLPDDIPGAARREIEKGNIRATLSLLYRGALMEIITRHKVELNASYTEGEVVATVAKSLPEKQISYFRSLTKEWIQTAYADRLSTPSSLLELCNNWRLLQVDP